MARLSLVTLGGYTFTDEIVKNKNKTKIVVFTSSLRLTKIKKFGPFVVSRKLQALIL